MPTALTQPELAMAGQPVALSGSKPLSSRAEHMQATRSLRGLKKIETRVDGRLRL